jgi:hypothetical protein
MRPLADSVADYLGKGAVQRQLEERTASLLGKEKAQYFHKGIIAQQCVARCI